MHPGVRAVTSIVLAAFVAFATPAVAGTPAGQCAAAKLKAAAHALEGKARCEASALQRGAPVDAACVAAAATHLAAAFSRADTHGGCLTPGDAAGVQAIVDDALAALLAALPAVMTTTSTSITTSTSTSSTSTSVPAGVCGNGVREAGESCDGGAFCNADCTLLTLAPGCCQSAGACRDASGWSLDFYMHQFCLPDPNVEGGVCGPGGTCDIVAITPVPLCCEAPDGTCGSAALPAFTATSTYELWHFFNYCEGITMRASHTLPAAFCNASNHCQPG